MTLPLLRLKALGINHIMEFEWISAPSTEAIIRALERLVRSGMIGEDGRLVEVGAKVAEFGVDVGVASTIWKSKEMKCSEEILTIAAMVSVQVVVWPGSCVQVLTPHVQDVFIIFEGAAGAIAELERRKFTAEEG
jgi:ATP-dependent RNA helicase DDX35